MIDIHTHTCFSHDGKENPADMILEAEKMGLRYLAFTDHLDLDYLVNPRYWLVSQLKVNKQFRELDRLCGAYSGAMVVAKGIEVGYSPEVVKKYRKIIESHRYDVVINSVHTIGNVDLYFKQFYSANTREQAFSKYLKAILDSVYADYSYDVIGHMGYMLRYSPYNPKEYGYLEFKPLIDDILTGIIERGKTLEVNTKTKDGNVFMPSADILRRYRELGGTRITLGSDAHKKEEIARKYSEASAILTELGFTALTVYRNREAMELPL